MNKKAYPLALLSLLTALPSEAQSVADTLSYTVTTAYRPDTLSNAQKTNQLLLQGALSAAPLVGIGVMQNYSQRADTHDTLRALPSLPPSLR